MLDHREKVSETTKRRAEEMIERNKTSSSNEKKTCAHCGTSKTPLWRGGPACPKSLCNACGIRNKKKRPGVEDKKRQSKKSSSYGGGDLKQRMVEKQRRKLGEEEQAAVLLMALSYGSVYA